MATEKLIVKNFGPIREAELDLRKVTVLIGEQASGKSVVAKLVAICHDVKKIFPILVLGTSINAEKEIEEAFMESMDFYDIGGFSKVASMIYFLSDNYQLQWNDNGLESQVLNHSLSAILQKAASLTMNNSDRELSDEEAGKLGQGLYNLLGVVEYIPAERIVVSVSDWDEDNIHYIDEFSVKFQNRMKSQEYFPLLIADNRFVNEHNRRKIQFKDKVIDYNKSSTGIQSLTPLQVIVETSNVSVNYLFIIEEPELNLYPTTQKKLVEYLIEKCTKGDNRLIITTHSPYILTALNNCIQAHNVAKLHPESVDEVNKLVPPQYQIAYEDVSAYYVGGGTVKSIMNEEFQMIDANALDDISEELSIVFDKLLDLKYQNQD